MSLGVPLSMLGIQIMLEKPKLRDKLKFVNDPSKHNFILL